MQKIKILICVLLTFNNLKAQTPASNYKIYNTSTGYELKNGQSELNHLVANQDIILWGEEHNDSIGHLLQLELLTYLHQNQQKRPIKFSMEMFQLDVQQVMDEYLAGWISEKNFKTETRAWNNYKDYSPMVEFCKKNAIPILCANTPARYTNMVTRGSFTALEILPKATKRAYLPPFPLDTLKGLYAQKFLEAMGGHTNPNMFIYQSQNLWDATMAHQILKASKKHRVFHIVGRFHTDDNAGITARVRKAAPQKNVLTISCFKAEKYIEKEHKNLANYVIITNP